MADPEGFGPRRLGTGPSQPTQPIPTTTPAGLTRPTPSPVSTYPAREPTLYRPTARLQAPEYPTSATTFYGGPTYRPAPPAQYLQTTSSQSPQTVPAIPAPNMVPGAASASNRVPRPVPAPPAPTVALTNKTQKRSRDEDGPDEKPARKKPVYSRKGNASFASTTLLRTSFPSCRTRTTPKSTLRTSVSSAGTAI